MTTGKDRKILRRLAAEVRRIAETTEQARRRRLWLDHNSLNSERPLILCFPEGAWNELIPDSELKCADPRMRAWEWNLRSKIYAWETIRDDSPIEPWFDVNWRINYGDYGVEVPMRHGKNRGSYKWNPPVKDIPRDMPLLKFRRPSVDRKSTHEECELGRDIFDGILPVRIRGGHWWTMGLTWEAILLVGLEEMMLLMCEAPADMHRLMAWLRDEHLNFIEWFESEGMLNLNNGADYVGSGGVGYTSELPAVGNPPGGPVRLKDLWGLGESQETAGVSPGMFSEFILPYQIPLLEKFGLNCYGCCESLDSRIDHVLKVPRLRRVSVAPWADQELMAKRLANRFVFSRKPNPALICTSFNEDEIRKDLRRTLEIAGEGSLEIIMKDTHTVQNQPWRISRWVEIAKEEVDRYMRT